MTGVLEEPSAADQMAFLTAVARSRRLHARLVSPPATPEAFERYLERSRAPSQVGYWVRSPDGELAGVINISEIVRGVFCSAYLGYYAFSPHNGRGHMTRGMRAVLREAFVTHRLHRLEANIQPGNEASSALIRRVGFSLEGFSPRYLKVGGRWRDHERWALTVESWRARRRTGSAREETV